MRYDSHDLASNSDLLDKLAKEARALADQVVDPYCKRLMQDIAVGYQRLAQHARGRQDGFKLAS